MVCVQVDVVHFVHRFSQYICKKNMADPMKQWYWQNNKEK